jgi:hypothetical protein
MIIAKYVPNIFENTLLGELEFYNTTEELYEVSFVKRFKDIPGFMEFRREGNVLSAVLRLEGGREQCLVVGIIEEEK